MTDWNWFFSSLAQSCAAIVGIFSAFIITKIVNNQNMYNTKNELTKKYIIITKQLKNNFYNRFLPDYVAHFFREELEKFNKSYPSNHPVDQFISYILSNIEFDFLKDNPAKLKEIIQNFVIDPQPNYADTIKSVFTGIELEPRLNIYVDRKLGAGIVKTIEEDDKRRNYIEDIKNHIDILHYHLGLIKCNPESSSIITKSLIISMLLMFIGVICPLFLLPIPIDTDPSKSSFILLKISLLIIILVCFIIIHATFFYANIKLKYDEKDINFLEENTFFYSYSLFLKRLH
jgi:hypothetical protein